MAVVYTEWDGDAGRYVAVDETYVDATGEAGTMPPRVEGDGLCNVCGESAAFASWVGVQTVQVCYRCAVETLPKLIADAAVGASVARLPWGPARHGPGATETIDQVTAEFWRAYSLAMEREARRPAGNNGP
jgi:hypothetical protein